MIPFSYNQDRCYFFPVDPTRAYAYWDYSAETWARLAAKGGRVVVMLLREGVTVQQVEIPAEAKTFYFTNLSARTRYVVRLWIRDGAQLEKLFDSPRIETPPNAPSALDAPRFATFHFLKRRLRKRPALDQLPARGYEIEGEESNGAAATQPGTPENWETPWSEAPDEAQHDAPRRAIFGYSSMALLGNGPKEEPAGTPPSWAHLDHTEEAQAATPPAAAKKEDSHE